MDVETLLTTIVNLLTRPGYCKTWPQIPSSVLTKLRRTENRRRPWGIEDMSCHNNDKLIVPEVILMNYIVIFVNHTGITTLQWKETTTNEYSISHEYNNDRFDKSGKSLL